MRILSLLIFLSFAASAQVKPYQTARLVSTGGTGVASLLVNEGLVLNPAALAFFDEAFGSYQKSSSNLSKKNPERSSDNRRFAKANFSEGVFAVDNSGSVKGGFGYIRQNENGYTRERASGAAAMRIIESLSLGTIVQHTQDTRPHRLSSHRHDVAIPFVLGLTWVPIEQLSIGAVYEDVGKALEDETRAIVGFQYSVTGDFVVMGDAGGNPRKDYAEENLWRLAAQYRLFNDLYVRAGQFSDHTTNQRGIGYGLSWAGPKLGVDVAMRTARQLEREKGFLYPSEKISDLSFALNMRF